MHCLVGLPGRLFLVAALYWCNVAIAGLPEGLDALRRNDYPAAVKELRPLADKGDSEAQYRIGLMYEFGKGYPQDKVLGIAWFMKSAAQNNTSAMQELGVIYATGDGVTKDDAEAARWFERAATLGNPAAQYNLGLLYAKGTGVQEDVTQAIAWFRKAAAQGSVIAQFKLGVAYENGTGVPKDDVLALANYAIAARSGTKEYQSHRDLVAARLTPSQTRTGLALADAWKVGQPMPTSATASSAQPTTVAAAPAGPAAPPAKNRCSATGTLGGEKFAATNCVVSLYNDQHSVAIWFNEDPITPQEVESFQLSSFADGAKAGKRRTMAVIMLCPGGGKETAAPAAVKSIDFNTNHAKSALAGVQWVIEAQKDFKVEKMTGDLKPGGVLSGKITGSRDKTSWNFDFDVVLPAKDAAAGMTCGN